MDLDPNLFGVGNQKSHLGARTPHLNLKKNKKQIKKKKKKKKKK